MDVGTKYIIAGLLVRFLKAAGYFEKDEVKSSEILIGKYSTNISFSKIGISNVMGVANNVPNLNTTM